MGGFEVKPGATTPDVFARADPSATSHDAYQDTYGIGDKWIVEGAKCTAAVRNERECFLPVPTRERLITDFQNECQDAANSYVTACEALKVKQLVAKDDDLSWVLGLVLDLAGLQVGAILSRAIARAAGPALRDAQKITAARTVAGAIAGRAPDASWETRGKALLAHVTPTHIDGWVKTGFSPATVAAKKKIAHEMTDVPAPTQSAKEHKIAFLTELEKSCKIAFREFAHHASAECDDAELIVIWHGMKQEFHSPDVYEAALAQKLDRFSKSGVPDIGRKKTAAHNDLLKRDVQRDTRVVWAYGVQGQKELWYQAEEGDYDSEVLLPGDADYPDTKDRKHLARLHSFGPRRPRGGPYLDRRVPDEFRDVALQHSEQVWGPTPTIRRNLSATEIALQAFGHYADSPMHDPTPTSKPTHSDPLAPFRQVKP